MATGMNNGTTGVGGVPPPSVFQNPSETKVLWSCVCRNDTILVEAGEDPFGGAVAQTAKAILGKKMTPGWEFAAMRGNRGEAWFRPQKSTQGEMPVPKLKAVKFHVYEHPPSDFDGAQPPIVWVFSAVYNPDATTWSNSRTQLEDVQSFLEKIVGLTEMPREIDEAWRTGNTLACQETFAPTLLQRMQEVTYLGNMARLSQSLEHSKQLMQDNIQMILDRDEQLAAMASKGTHLENMAQDFKKKTTGIRKRMMWQNAKHGMVLGTAITVGVGIVVVPPLVALL